MAYAAHPFKGRVCCLYPCGLVGADLSEVGRAIGEGYKEVSPEIWLVVDGSGDDQAAACSYSERMLESVK